jgi:hypothetical protein
MAWYVENFHWVLYVTGTLTATVALMAVRPVPQFKAMFGVELSDPRLILAARQFGVYVGLLGLLLIYVGFEPAGRFPILLLAIVSKASLVALMALNLKDLAGTSAKQVIVADALMVVLYVAYLAAM